MPRGFERMNMVPWFETEPKEIIEELRAWDAARPRSRQTAIGMSELADCEAAIGFKLADTWETDDPDLWGAIRGTMLHDAIERVRAAAHPDHRFGIAVIYRGVPGHVDEVARRRVIDWKTSRLANIATWRRDAEATNGKWQQVMGYAAALIDAGELDEADCEVSLLCIPVDGRFADWVELVRPFDRAVIDRALDRLDDIRSRQAVGEPLRREKPWAWCEHWCAFFAQCRDSRPQTEPISDPEIVGAARIYGEEQAIESAAKKAKDRVRPLLIGVRGSTGEWSVTMTEPKGTKAVLDEERVRADYAASGIDVPTCDVPTATPSLRVTRVKER